MKRKLDARSAWAGLLAGSLAGMCGGYVLARAKARREYATRLDAAVADVKQHYSRPLLPKILEEDSEDPDVVKLIGTRPGARWKDVILGAVKEESVPDPLEGLDPESDDDGSDVSPGPAGEDSSAEEPPFPFEISREQFGELAEEGFQTISVTYYAADKVLCDNDDPIRDVQGTVGTLHPLAFGGVSGDPNIRYVRNRRLEVDFEICLDARSYTETVLGYGRPPNKPKEASARTKTAT